MKTTICPTCGLPCPKYVLLPWDRRLDWLLISTWITALALCGAVLWLLAYLAISLWRY